jgi:hypothetical protein
VAGTGFEPTQDSSGESPIADQGGAEAAHSAQKARHLILNWWPWSMPGPRLSETINAGILAMIRIANDKVTFSPALLATAEREHSAPKAVVIGPHRMFEIANTKFQVATGEAKEKTAQQAHAGHRWDSQGANQRA